jgi:hypothetical protein
VTTGLSISGVLIADRRALALLSDVNEYSLDMQVDAVPEGFEVIHSKHGIEFYCASCDIPVEP